MGGLSIVGGVGRWKLACSKLVSPQMHQIHLFHHEEIHSLNRRTAFVDDFVLLGFVWRVFFQLIVFQ